MKTESVFHARSSRALRAAGFLPGATLLLAAGAGAQFAPIGISSVGAQAFFNEALEGFPPEEGDRFAWALAAGDFNGDGAQDLATGMPYDSGPPDLPLSWAGAVIVRWGTPGVGLSAVPVPTLLSLYATGGPAQAHVLDEFGWALAAGDFDGDGRDDLAVGAPHFENYHFQNDRDLGAVLIYYGQPGGIQIVAEEFFYSGPLGNVFDPPDLYDYLGKSLAAGDFDGDGFSDLAMGAPQDFNVSGFPGGGAVVVVHGSSEGLMHDDGGVAAYLIHQDDPPVPDDGENPDDFGYALAAGNFNGDIQITGDGFNPVDDLAISAPGEDGIGAVMVMLGSPNGLIFSQSIYLGQGDVGTDGEANDQFGTSLAVGNFDGDCRPVLIYCPPFDDLAIGAPFENLGAGNEIGNAGQVTVLFGASAGFFDWSRTRNLTQGSIYVPGGGLDETGDAFGFALAAGDFNGDGRDELAVGQPGEDGGRGGATILLGSSGVFGGQYQFVTPGQNGAPPDAQDGSNAGRALAAGDFDGDGHSDLAIGIPLRDQGGLADSGAETILHGAMFADGFANMHDLFWSGSAP